jgi:UDPglucose 6-dehydrogenase
MNRPLVIDLRNIYNPAEMRAAGLDYHSIGRPASMSALQPRASSMLRST